MFNLKLMFKKVALLIIVVSCSACADKLANTKVISNSSTVPTEKSVVAELPELNFSIKEGKIYNKFFRQGNVAAHTLLKSGTSPRVVVAFPAGNSGVSLWFNALEQPMQWQEIQQISALQETNKREQQLYGIEAQIITSAKRLEVKQAVLSSVRVIRDYLHSGVVASEIKNALTVNKQRVTWVRDRLDGKGSYKLDVEVMQGHVTGGNGTPIIFTAENDLPLVLKIKALSGDKPLTPIVKNDLLTTTANDQDEMAKNVLAFLSYQEKMLAGSWRFATYFGRDTLMSVRLLMPVLQPAVIEAGLGSVIERLNNYGEVAHEEDIGEFAVLRHLRENGQGNEQAFYDYKMVDDDYLLAPIIAEYLLNQDLATAKAFLSRKTHNGQLYSERLLANFDYVMSMTNQYANNPKVENLIEINKGDTVGEWRDSGEGLGFGRMPYNVNAVFVPAALNAIAQLVDSGLFTSENTLTARFGRASTMAKVWQQKAPAHFKVTLTAEEAKHLIQQHAQKNGVPQNEALSSIGVQPLTYNALSLGEQGKAIAVMHSDDGFTLLFSKPSEAELLNIIKVTLRPYPAGLLTPVGMLVANPVYTTKGLKQYFSNQHYHGEVIWSWQQALFAAGLERQLLRKDLSQLARNKLLQAQEKLWRVINATGAINNAELWSWSFKNGQYQVESFGQRSGDKTESNAAQLWSTVYLAIKPPNH
jgi:glycogen debranching enzyme